MAYICPKNVLLQLKHYIQRIYLTLLSTTCVKIHQMTYVIFETLIHFSRHNSSIFFQLKHYIISTKVVHQTSNFEILHCLFKVHQFPNVSFQTSKLFFKVWIFFQCHGRQLFCTLLAETLYYFDERNPSKCQISDF